MEKDSLQNFETEKNYFENKSENQNKAMLSLLNNIISEKEYNLNEKVLTILKLIFFVLIILCFMWPFKNQSIKIIDVDNEMSLKENNIDFSGYSTDIKTIVLYLPQYHSIKENDEWWGKGFTEWVNVKKAKPLYDGHYQPKKPGDPKDYLGYYELTNPEVLKKQAKLAKMHGIYGFGIYYYWFSGKTLLDKPLKLLLENKDIDLKFFLIWANENWTRRWDGLDNEVLIEQLYKEDDPQNFIKDIKQYLIDERYIKFDNKPIIGVYEPTKIKEFAKVIKTWRELCKQNGIGEIYIIVTLNDNSVEKLHNYNLFNATYQFPPRGIDYLKYYIKNEHFKLAYASFILYYTAWIYDEKNIENDILKDFKFYKGTLVGFDNSPRKAQNYVIFYNRSPEQFYLRNKKNIEWTQKNYKKDDWFIFVNAWNEWGEGAYLEPDDKYGYAFINALSKAIFNLPYNNISYLQKFSFKSKIAVQIHIFDEGLINDIITKTNNIPIKYDLFLSLYNRVNETHIEEELKKYSSANYYQIKINKYDDNISISYLTRIRNYKYICHLHTKINDTFGEEWRQYLFNNLLGTQKIVSEILTDLENNNKLGFVFPETFYKAYLKYENKVTEEDKKYILNILKKIDGTLKPGKIKELPNENMFWARIDSIKQIFNRKIIKVIYNENNIKNGDKFHFIEALWLYLVKLNGYYYKKIFKSF